MSQSRHNPNVFDLFLNSIEEVIEKVVQKQLNSLLPNLIISALEQQKPSTEKDLLSVDEVAKLLKWEKGTVYNYTHNNEIPHIKKGGKLYFKRSAIMEWLEKDEKKSRKQRIDQLVSNGVAPARRGRPTKKGVANG